jgi:hypothetical protein
VIFSLVSHKALRWLSPVFALSAFVSSLLLAGEATGYTILAAAQLLLVAFALAGCIPTLRRIAPLATAHYFCLLQAAAIVGFIRGAFGRQSVLWRRFDRTPGPASVA